MVRSLARLAAAALQTLSRFALGLLVVGWLFLPACDCRGGGASDAGDDGGADPDGGGDGGTCPDLDGDQHTDAACGGDDCDDGDATVSPDAIEVCDGVDNDCVGGIDDGGDALCEDGNACTTDTCEGALGCRNVDADGLACSVGACSGVCAGGLCGGCACNTNAECDDGVGCTVDTCASGACINLRSDVACDDGLFCTGIERCDALLDCQPGTPPACVDGVGCTVDACDGVTDSCTNTASDAACDDGLFCTGVETCDPVSDCRAGTPPSCSDGVGCTVDVCAGATDACGSMPSDAACDDGLFCTGAETCDPVADCQAGTPPACDDGVGCTTDACDGFTDGCSNAPSDVACDDGLFCTGVETCDAVADCQAGTPPACDDGVGCTTDACDGASDSCGNTPSDAACDDGLFCTGIETCSIVLDCQAGTPPACDDGVGCTTDACDGATDGCANTPSDAACDDGLFCTGTETCDPVTDCQAGVPPVCDDGVSCSTDSCSGVTDACDAVADDSACDDGNACTTNTCGLAGGCQVVNADGAACSVGACSGICAAGLCGGCSCNVDPDCDDGVSCTIDSCTAGSCSNLPSDASCDDGLFCDGAETCDAVADCQPGAPPACDDGVGCTADSCDGAADACVNAPDDAACDDGLFCTGAESCSTVLDCQAGTPPGCDDGVGCTVDGCDGASDACVNAPVDLACDDGRFCTGNETCDAVADCLPGTPPSCDDGVDCTVDGCDGGTDACGYTPDDGACDDGLFCTGNETCDAVTDCQAGPPPSCDDGVACTVDACDGAADACVNASDDSACDDGLFCSGAESCDAQLGCQPGLVPFCDDSIACTVDGCDGGLDACLSTADDLLCGGGLTCDLFLGCIGGDACASPLTITGTGTQVGDTSASSPTHTGSCGGAGAELVFELSLGVLSDVLLDTAGSAIDTVLYLRQADCDTGLEFACNDDADAVLSTSRLELPALAAGTYFVFVDSASSGGAVTLGVTVTPVGFLPIPAVADDPLVRMPGTQPADGVVLEASGRCLNCHDGYDPAVEPGSNWNGSMMAQASRDPIYWATFAVAVQDSVWLMGNANAGDLCLRCHFPRGWLGGRSDPPTGTAMTGADYEGVSCDTCHRLFDPFHETTWDGSREGSDWVGYWGETNASGTPSQAAADATRAADRGEAALLTLYNGGPAFDASSQPVSPAWGESSSAQMFVAASTDKRASFADATARHGMRYSRYHKSKYLCATCHDVSNPVLANLAHAGTPPGDGTTVLPTEAQTAASYGHVERTFSEFMLSDFGLPGGATGTGAYDPAIFETSVASNAISTCQDCHLPDAVGKGCDKNDSILRPTDSIEHPECGQPVHDLTGGNAWVPWLLASTIPGSPNYDPTNQALLDQGPAALILDLSQGEAMDADALLAASARAIATLQKAATVENVVYDPATGALDFRIDNHSGHKLASGYPEGRRLFVNVRVLQGATLLQEVNPYDATAATLRGLPYPGSPPLGAGETHEDTLVYESHPRSALTGEDHSFHFVLATDRYKDNRIPPKGFRIAEAAARLSEPAWAGAVDPGLYMAAEYAGGWDDVSIIVAPGATTIEVRLYYQTTSREYVAFLRDEILGTGATLPSPTPSGRALAYVLQTDPALSGLAAWGDTMWQLWDRNKGVPGAAPIECAQGVWP